MTGDNPHLVQFIDLAQQCCDGEGGGLRGDLGGAAWPYEEDELVDQGGKKRIIRCLDRRSGRIVARAECLQEGDAAEEEKFLREARLTAQLQHPNIIPVHEIGLTPAGHPYFVMKLVEGRSLQQLLDALRDGDGAASRDYPLATRIDIFSRICEAVAYAHRRGILHLDLKPANIQLSQLSRHGEVLVCDWGLARVLDAVCEDPQLLRLSLDPHELKTLTRDGFVKGSPGYMAPEQAGAVHGVKDRRSDVFSLGALLYSLLAYQPPFDGADVAEVLAATRRGRIQPFPRPPPPGLEAICRKALQRRPEDRYGDVDELLDELAAWRYGFATAAEKASFGRQLLLFGRRHVRIVAPLAVSILVLAAATLLFIQGLNHKEAAAQEARRRAESSEAQLRRETAARLRLAHDVAPRYMQLALEAEEKMDFDAALNYGRQAVEIEPALGRAWQCPAQVPLGRQNFAAAAGAYRKAGGADNLLLAAWAEEFALQAGAGEITAAAWTSLFARLQALDRPWIFERLIRLHVERRLDIGQRLSFLHEMLSLQQPGSKEIRLSWKDGRLDLAGNDRLSLSPALRGLPVRELDLSHTGVADLRLLASLPLESLRLAGAPCRDLSPLAGLPLRHLDLRGCPVADLAPLAGLPLVSLDLRGCPSLNLAHLQACRDLRQVAISRERATLEQCRRLLPEVEWHLGDEEDWQ
jgi:tetratricopeptide (TPR) repeat protein